MTNTSRVLIGCLVACLIGWAVTYYLVEERRDANAETYYQVATKNKNQLLEIQRLVKAMPPSAWKDSLWAVVDTIDIVITRGEKKYNDSIQQSKIDSMLQDSIKLKEDQIIQEALDTVPSYQNGRLFHLKFDGNLNDELGNHTPVGIGTPTYVDTPSGQGAVFGPTNAFYRVDIPHTTDFDLVDFSISYVVRVDPAQTTYAIGMEKRSGNTDHWGLNMWVTENFYLTVDDANYGTTTGNATDFLNDGVTWYHVTGVYDHNNLEGKIYINGVLAETMAITAPTLQQDVYDVSIGQRKNSAGAEHFYGTMDEASLWNRPLTAQEAQDLYDDYVTSTIDADATAFIDAVGTLTADEEIAIRNLVGELKANGNWDKYLAIYPFVGTTAASQKWNLKDPRDLDSAFRLTFNGNVTHHSRGYNTDGLSGSYVDTHIVPNANTTAMDFQGTWYVQTNERGNYTDWGSEMTSGGARLIGQSGYGQEQTSDLYNYTTSHRAKYIDTDEDARGLYTASRISNSDNSLYKDGGLLAQTTASIAGYDISGVTSPIHLSGHSRAGVSTILSPRTFSFFAFGLGLNATQANDDATAIENFHVSLDRSYKKFKNDMVLNGGFDTSSPWVLLNGSTISNGVARIVNNGNLGSTGGNWSLKQANVFSETETEVFRLRMRARRISGTGELQIAQEYWGLGQDVKDALATITTDWTVIDVFCQTSRTDGRDTITFGGMTVGDVWEIDWVTLEYVTEVPTDGLVSMWDHTSIDPLAVSEGDDIGVWADVISGNDGTQTGTKRPKLHIDAVTGKRQVRFDGVDDWLNVGQPANLNFQAGTDSITIIAKMGENPFTKGYAISKRPATSSQAQFTLFLETATQIQSHIGQSFPTFVNIAAIASKDVWSVQVDTTTKTFKINDVDVGTRTGEIGSSMNTADINIGGRTNGSFLANGDLEFLAVYNKRLTDLEMSRVYQVLKNN